MVCPNCQETLEIEHLTREYEKESIYFNQCKKCGKIWYKVVDSTGTEWFEITYDL